VAIEGSRTDRRGHGRSDQTGDGTKWTLNVRMILSSFSKSLISSCHHGWTLETGAVKSLGYFVATASKRVFQSRAHPAHDAAHAEKEKNPLPRAPRGL